MGDTVDDYLANRVQTFIDWLNKHVPATLWPDERFKRKFAQRSIAEIVDDRDTSFIGACFDYTSLASHYIGTYIDDQHRVGVEILRNDNQHNAGTGIHTYASFHYHGEEHTLDFSDRTNVYLYKGSYTNAQPHVSSLQTFLLPAPKDPTKNLFENYADRLQHLPFSLQGYLAHVSRYNNTETYQRYQQEIGNQKLLTLKNYHPSKAPKPI